MDNLTHGLVGLGLAGLRKNNLIDYREPLNQRAVFWATALGSQFPDLDIVYRFISEVAYLQHHRGVSHSLISLMIIPLVITGILKVFFPIVKSRMVYFWAWLATLVHILLDLLTSYGTMALWPVNSVRYAWDVLMIVDPIIIIIFFIGMYIVRKTNLGRRQIYALIFAITIGYISSRAYIHHQLITDLHANNLQAGVPMKEITRTSVVPNLLGYNKWHFVVETPRDYTTGTISYWPRKISIEQKVSRKEDKLVKASKQAPVVGVFSKFARFPSEIHQKKGSYYLINWVDLRYSFSKHSPFSAYVILDKNYKIIESGLGTK